MVREGVHHVYHLFVIETDRRDQLAKHLADRKIQTGVHYPIPSHLQPGTLSRQNGSAMRLTHTEETAGRILSLPMFPALALEDAECVVQAILDFFAGTAR